MLEEKGLTSMLEEKGLIMQMLAATFPFCRPYKNGDRQTALHIVLSTPA